MFLELSVIKINYKGYLLTKEGLANNVLGY